MIKNTQKLAQLLLLVVCLFMTVKGTAQQNSETVDLNAKVPLDKNTIMGTLDNGLKYFILENKKPEKKAELRLVINAGSILENDNQLGLAHFLEHMAFNGSENFDKNGIVDYLQSIGVRFGADLNASTGFDETTYILPIPTDDKEKFDKGMQILRDWAGGLKLEEEEIDKERGVIQEEWRSGKGLQERIRDQVLPIMLYQSRYADRLPIGTMDVVMNFDYQRIRDFYNDWYRPNLMAVVAVGDFDGKEVEKQIKEMFSSLKNPANERKREVYTVPDHEETLVKIVRDKEATSTSVQIYTKMPEQKVKTQADLRREYVENLYNQMLNMRLYEIGTKPDAPFLYGYAAFTDFLADKDAYVISTAPKENQTQDAVKLVLRENYRVKQHGFTATELERAKSELLSRLETAYNERDKTPSAQLLADYVDNFTEGNQNPSIEYRFQFVKNVLPGITLEEVNKLSDKVLPGKNTVVIVTGPEREEVDLSNKDELLAIMKDAANEKLEPYEDIAAGKQLLEDVPAAGKVVETQEFADLGATTWTLSNGVKVTLKPTDFQNDEIGMTAFRFGGHSLCKDEDYQSAARADGIVEMGGLGEFSEVQLSKMLAGNTASVSPSIGELTEGVRGSCAPKDFETMMQLTYLTFTAPRKDEERFASYIDQLKNSIKNLLDDPNAYFKDVIAKTLSQNHLRAADIPTLEEVDKIDLDVAYNFYKERFANAGGFHFYFVGNFDLEQVKPLIELYLGGLPGDPSYQSNFKDNGIEKPKGVVKKDIKKQSEPKSTVLLVLHGDYPKSTLKDRLVMNILGQVTLIRLTEDLREERGGVYSPWAGTDVSFYPSPEYAAQVYFMCDPERVEELVGATFEEMESMHKEIKEVNLNKAKQALLEQHKEQLKKNNFWLSVMYQKDYQQEPYSDILKFEETVNNITVKDIQKAAQKYLTDKQYAEFILSPKE
ncbi:insulinase family protein [Limibacter armeniacum]|uniref:M16 family metallopeptidase n=1 Tax=Limibacter armeniacum TaxID=466084 RepID=UPI002FE5B928